MTSAGSNALSVAIACGGTGGHLFPGLAVAREMVRYGCRVTLLVSAKQVDQEAVRQAEGMRVITLPAVGFAGGNYLGFVLGFVRSYRTAKRAFQDERPAAALAMGGFTSAPPILAAKRLGARSFLHESNSVPGRANRWLSWFVDQAFVGFNSATQRLHARTVVMTGTPVRREFQCQDSRECRARLGLEPDRPTVLVMGGSQGARGVNRLVEQSLPKLARQAPEWQWVHIAGDTDASALRQVYGRLKLRSVLHPFFADMALAMGAATVGVSRAGASSLAELAAVRLPAVLIPFPAATDNHQFCNALSYSQSGAAQLLEQDTATPDNFCQVLLDLVRDGGLRARMQSELGKWHFPEAAERIARVVLSSVGVATCDESGKGERSATIPCSGNDVDGRHGRRFLGGQSWVVSSGAKPAGWPPPLASSCTWRFV